MEPSSKSPSGATRASVFGTDGAMSSSSSSPREAGGRPLVSHADPASVLAWLADVHPLVEDLYAYVMDATAKKSQRLYSRVHLRGRAGQRRRTLRKLFVELESSASPAPAEVGGPPMPPVTAAADP